MTEDMGHFRRSLERRRFHVIASLLPRSGIVNVLDAGAGSGWLSEILCRRGYSVHAVDLGLDSLHRASSRIKIQKKSSQPAKDIFFALGDIYRLPYGDCSFDAVVASEIIEHLENPEKAFRELSRIIRPGGVVIVSTPYREKIEHTLCIHCNKKTPVNAHLHSFDKEKMEHLLASAGFTVRKTNLFVNRHAERLGLAGFTSYMPHCIWRAVDYSLCSLLGRQTFMAVKAVK